MKIGKISFDLHFEPNDGKFFVTMEQESVTLKQEEVQQGPRTGKVENTTASDEVQLDPDSDDFAEKKSALKAAGIFFTTGLPRPGVKRRDPRRLTPTDPKPRRRSQPHRKAAPPISKPTGLEMLPKSSSRKTTRISIKKRSH